MSSSSSGQLERAAKAASQAVRDAAESGTSRRQVGALAALRKRAIQMAVVVAVIFGLSWAFGSLISARTGAFLFVALVFGSFATSWAGEVSPAFVASALALLALVAEFAFPPWLSQAYAPLTAVITEGLGLRVPAVTFAVLVFTGIVVMWIVEIRFTSAATRASGQPIAANPDTVARRLAARIERLFEDYVNITVAFVALLVAMAGLLLAGAGDVGGQLGEVIGQAPVLAAGVLNWAFGGVALGWEPPVISEWPVVGDVFSIVAGFGFGEFMLFGAVALLAAIAYKNTRN